MSVSRSETPDLAALLDAYAKHLSVDRTVKTRSIRQYRETARTFISHRQDDEGPLRASTLLDATSPDVFDFLLRRRSTCTFKTVVAYRHRLRGLYEFLEETGVVAENPVVFEWLTGGEKRGRLGLSTEEVAAVFRLFVQGEDRKWISARDNAILLLYLRHQLTPQQIRSMKLSAFSGSHVRVRDKMSGGEMEILLADEVADALKEYLEAMPTKIGADDALFRANRLGPFGIGNHDAFLRKKAQAAGVRYSPTLLRNSSPVLVDELAAANRVRRAAAGEEIDTASIFASFRSTHPRWWA